MLTNTELDTLADKLSCRIEHLKPKRLINTRVVLDRVCLSRTQLWRKLKEGSFPIPKITSTSGRAWLESDIDDWLGDFKGDDWQQYLARAEKKAVASKAALERKAAETET